MAKSKKIKTKEINKIEEFIPCEWMVQFDNDAPQRFAYADENSTSKEVIITLSNNKESYINFVDSKTNKSFKIFARKPLL